MKTNVLLAFFFFFFSMALFALTIAGFEIVRDSDGDAVVNGGKYNLFPQYFDGAAIASAETKNPARRRCLLAVVESCDYNVNSTKIASPRPEHYIGTKLPLDISFYPLPTKNCTRHPEWLVATDDDFGHDAVMVGLPSEYLLPHPGRFRFINSDSHHDHQYLYGLQFCYEQTDGHCECKDVGVKTDRNENRRLIVAEVADPLVLELRKASDVDAVASEISI